MILQERHCPRGPPAHQPRRLARSIPQSPELAALEDRMQDTFGRDVKGGGISSRIIEPVDYALPVSVLHMRSDLRPSRAGVLAVPEWTHGEKMPWQERQQSRTAYRVDKTNAAAIHIA